VEICCGKGCKRQVLRHKTQGFGRKRVLEVCGCDEMLQKWKESARKENERREKRRRCVRSEKLC
jgi:hypothetical protein